MAMASFSYPEKQKTPVKTEVRRRPGYPQSLGGLCPTLPPMSTGILGRIGRFLSVVFILFLGWLTPIHGISPAPSTDLIQTLEIPKSQTQATLTHLEAYRPNGPPNQVKQTSSYPGVHRGSWVAVFVLNDDPVIGGANWYAYAGGDPVNRWDPNGLRAIVRNEAWGEFKQWWRDNASLALDNSKNDKFSFGYPSGNEGAYAEFSINPFKSFSNVYSKYKEINIIGDIDVEKLTTKDREILDAITDPNKLYVFDKNGWREGNESDEGGNWASFVVNEANFEHNYIFRPIGNGLGYVGQKLQPFQNDLDALAMYGVVHPGPMGVAEGFGAIGAKIGSAGIRVLQGLRMAAPLAEKLGAKLIPKLSGVSGRSLLNESLTTLRSSSFQSATNITAQETKNIETLLSRLANRGDLQWAGRSGGYAGIDPELGRMVFKVGQGRFLYSTQGRIAHELTHVLQEVRNPGLYAREAGLMGKPFSFSEVFNIERQAYLSQHGGNFLGKTLAVPEAALNAGLATNPVTTYSIVVGGGGGLVYGINQLISP